MASIERTAYPRFKSALTAHELEELYCPTEEDFDFVYGRADDPAQLLTLLVRLKCHQHLGYLPPLGTSGRIRAETFGFAPETLSES